MTIEQLLNHYQVKNDTQLARILNVTKSAVSKWRNDGMTIERQCYYEVLTGGAVKADRNIIDEAQDKAAKSKKLLSDYEKLKAELIN